MGINENIKNNTREQEKFNKAAQDGYESFSDYRDILKNINEDLGKNYKVTKETQKEYNSLISITKQLTSQEEDITRLSDKQLNSLKEKATLNVREIQSLASQINDKETISMEEESLLEAKKQNFKIEKDILAAIDKQVTQRKEANKAMGVAGNILKGLNKLAPNFAKAIKIDEVAKDMQQFADETAKAGNQVSRLKTLSIGFQSSLKNGLKTLTDPTVIIGAIIKGFLSIDKAQTEFQRQTGDTVDTFDTLNLKLLTSAEYIASATELTKELGLNAANVFTKEDITEVAVMTKQIGLSVKEANNLAIQSQLHGMSIEESNEALINGNKSHITGRKILEDVANVSEEIAVSYAGYPGELAAAAAAARKLGMDLGNVDKIAGSLLQFESSISAEMEAELLTGKSLNLEKARQAALDNDLLGVAKELANQGITMASFGRMNRIQQEAQAKALGMSRTEMAKSLMMKEMEAGLDRDSLSNSNKLLYDDLKRLSVQEKFTTALAKLQESLIPIIGSFAELLTHTTAIKIALGAIGTLMIGKFALGAVSVTKSFGNIFKSTKGIADASKAASGMNPLQGVKFKKSLLSLSAGLRSFGTAKVFKGIGALAALAVAGVLMIPGSVGLAMFGGASFIAASGMAVLTPALIALGTALTSGVAGVGLAALVGVSLGLGAAFALVGVGALAMGKGISLAAGGFATMVPNLISLVTSLPQLFLLGAALMSIGAGLSLIAIAGMAAIPALLALGTLGAVAGSLFGDSEGGSTGESPSKGGSMAGVEAKLDKLISLVEAGGDVFIDGSKVGKTLQLSSSTMG